MRAPATNQKQTCTPCRVRCGAALALAQCTGDGVVDGDDLNVVRGNYLAALPPPAAAGAVVGAPDPAAGTSDAPATGRVPVPGASRVDVVSVNVQPYEVDSLYVFASGSPGIDSQMRLSAFSAEAGIRLTEWLDEDVLDQL